MEITRSSVKTQTGAADWFTGDVYIDAVAAPAGTSTFAAAAVHFTPGARTAWHTHPHGQTIYVTEGVGLCQREGGSIEVIRPGDRVFFEPGENHWHRAAPDRTAVVTAGIPGFVARAGRWLRGSTSRSARSATPKGRRHHRPSLIRGAGHELRDLTWLGALTREIPSFPEGHS
jgi:quercetin dioxygenase-like cupin family protein